MLKRLTTYNQDLIFLTIFFSFQVGKEMLCPRQNGESGSGNGGEEGGFNLLMELLRGDL